MIWLRSGSSFSNRFIFCNVKANVHILLVVVLLFGKKYKEIKMYVLIEIACDKLK